MDVKKLLDLTLTIKTNFLHFMILVVGFDAFFNIVIVLRIKKEFF